MRTWVIFLRFVHLMGFWASCLKGSCHFNPPLLPGEICGKNVEALGSSLADLPDDCDPPLPEDESIRSGVLRNGLTYKTQHRYSLGDYFHAELKIPRRHDANDMEGDEELLERAVMSIVFAKIRFQSSSGVSHLEKTRELNATVYSAQGTGIGDFRKLLKAFSDVLQVKVNEAELNLLRDLALGSTLFAKSDFRQFSSSVGVKEEYSEKKIRNWSMASFERFLERNHRPDNVILYITGAIGPAFEEEIRSRLSWGNKALPKSGRGEGTMKETHSRDFPSSAHSSSTLSIPLDGPDDVRVLVDDIISEFRFEMAAKCPMESVKSLRSFRRIVLKDLASKALNNRLKKVVEKVEDSGGLVEGALFEVYDVKHLGYEERKLTVRTTHSSHWKAAVSAAFREERRFAKYGLSPTELDELRKQSLPRFTSAKKTSIPQQVLYSESFTAPEKYSDLLYDEQVWDISVEEMNEFVRELCSHSLWFEQDSTAPAPNTIFASGPSLSPHLNRVELMAMLQEVAKEDLAAVKSDEVLESLMSDEEIVSLSQDDEARWIGESECFSDRTSDTTTVLRELSNGFKISILAVGEGSTLLSERAQMVVSWRGGKLVETEMFEDSFGTRHPRGSILLGAMAMEVGTAFGRWSAEQVKDFFARHEIIKTVSAEAQSLSVRFSFPSDKLAQVLQILRGMILDFRWDSGVVDDARIELLSRWRQLHASDCIYTYELLRTMKGIPGNIEQDLGSLDVDGVSRAIRSHLSTDGTSLFIYGHFEVDEVQEKVRQYIGTLPYVASELGKVSLSPWPLAIRAMGQHFLIVSRTRAQKYVKVLVAGAMPSLWGFNADGTHAILKDRKPKQRLDGNTLNHIRELAVFPYVTILILEKLIESRLHVAVQRMHLPLALRPGFNSHVAFDEHTMGGMYFAQLYTASENAPKALEIMVKTLSDLQGLGDSSSGSRFSEKEFEAARKAAKAALETGLKKGESWILRTMEGIQNAENEYLGGNFVRDVHILMANVCFKDAQELLKAYDFDATRMFTCFGIGGSRRTEQQLWD